MKALKHHQNFKKQCKWILLGLYVAGVTVRYLLTYFFTAGITVYIDEPLYINLAKSLFYDGEVLYRAQPISYVYLLYPISLFPVFLMPSGVNLYRCVQLWNIMLMTSMIFPSFLMSRKMGLKEKQALTVSVLSLLLPENFFSTRIVCESLIYPCVMWVFLLSLHVIEKPQKLWLSIVLGAIGGAMYFIKANCIVFSASFLAVSLLYGIQKKQRIRLVSSMLALLTMGLVLAGGYLLYGVLFEDVSLLTLYEKQIPTFDVQTVLIMVQGTIYHLFAAVFCLGPVLCAFPVLNVHKMREENKLFFSALLVGILCLSISIGIMIVPYNYTGTWSNCPTHTRYFAYCLLPIIAGLFLPELEKQQIGKKTAVMLWVLAALFILPSPFTCFTTQAGTFDSPSLNTFFAHEAGVGVGIVTLLLLTFVNVYQIKQLKVRGLTDSLRRSACYMLAVYMMVNSIMIYNNYHTVDRDIEQDANIVSNAIEKEEVLIVTQNHYDDVRGLQLDAHLRRPQYMVVMNNVLLNAVEHGGQYVAFEPLVQAPNITSRRTPEQVKILLFDITCADYVEFTKDVELSTTPNGLYTIAKIPEDRPYLKSALASMDGFVLYPSTTSSLLIFDEKMLERGNTQLTMTFSSYGQATGELVFSVNGSKQTLPVTASKQTYTIELPITKCAFFHCSISSDVPVVIYSYKTE